MKKCNWAIPSQNNIKTTSCISKYFYLLNNLFHQGSAINAVHSHQQFHLAHPHSFSFYLGNTAKSPADSAGFGSVTHEHGDAHAQKLGPCPHPEGGTQQAPLMLRP